MQPLLLRRLVAILILVLGVTAPPLLAAGDGTTKNTTSSGAACPNPPACGSHCSNTPFAPTDCWTTQYGPAPADVVISPGGKFGSVESTNMLYCPAGSYALCFFSGPSTPTGNGCPSSSGCKNNRLPCVLSADGKSANCTCQFYTADAQHPYFVDINGILNLGAYDETVQVCGQDGSLCANIQNCGKGLAGCPNPQPCSAPGTGAGCLAPVCKYVQHQNKLDPKVSLIPGAEVISTFSFAMDSSYTLGSSPCSGSYAGCMTAPCKFTSGSVSTHSPGDPIQCECPTYDGTYQIGQNHQHCSIHSSTKGTSYVWSASNTVVPASPPPKN
ncbi:MAG TPA: hypothetical protein VJA16_06015 [Thermoanaerobaculia bacterium]